MLPTLEQMMISHESSLRNALVAIEKNAQRIIFVVNSSRKLIGILTDGDVRRALLRDKDLNTPVFEVANKSFVSLPIDSSQEEISKTLGEKYRHIPLVNADGILMDYACLHRIHRIPIMDAFLNGNELKYVSDCVKSKWISSQGKYVIEFEQRFAELCGGGYPVAVSNGTVALHLALVALGIKPGDEVIVPDLTFAASINTIIHAGATPVLVDVCPKTWCIDPVETKKAITKKTKAIMPVHLYGQPSNMDRLKEIADENRLLIIEDAAEAIGSLYKGKFVGTLGDAGTFSFYGNKMVTTGEGGMILFKDQKHAERARMLRDHGMSKEKRYWHLEVGYNYRMTNLQAAIGVAQLEQFEEILSRKLKLAATYRSTFKDWPGLTLPPDEPFCRNVHWLYTVLVDEKYFGTRDHLMNKLLQNGIETRPVFYPLHTMPPYQQYKGNRSFSNSIYISTCGMSLPSSAGLTDKEMELISKTLKEIVNVREMMDPQYKNVNHLT